MTTGFDLEEREYAQENKDVGKTSIGHKKDHFST